MKASKPTYLASIKIIQLREDVIPTEKKKKAREGACEYSARLWVESPELLPSWLTEFTEWVVVRVAPSAPGRKLEWRSNPRNSIEDHG